MGRTAEATLIETSAPAKWAASVSVTPFFVARFRDGSYRASYKVTGRGVLDLAPTAG